MGFHNDVLAIPVSNKTTYNTLIDDIKRLYAQGEQSIADIDNALNWLFDDIDNLDDLVFPDIPEYLDAFQDRYYAFFGFITIS